MFFCFFFLKKEVNARKHVEDEIYCTVWLFLWETEVLKYRCTVRIHAARLPGSWKGLAVPCSTLLSGCFQFSNFQSFSCQKSLL